MIAVIAALLTYEGHQQEHGAGNPGGMHQVIERRRGARLVAPTDHHQQGAGGENHHPHDHSAQGIRRQNADGAGGERRQAEPQQPAVHQTCQRAGMITEQQVENPQHGVDAHLGENGKQGTHGAHRRRIGARQPEQRRQQRPLQTEYHQQQQTSATQQQFTLSAGFGHKPGHMGHVQGSGAGIDHGQGDQEQTGASEIEHHIVQRRTGPGLAGAVHQQGVGCNQQHFKEHEQVEQVSRQESTIDAHELEVKQRMVTTATSILSAHGKQQGGHRQHRSGQQKKHTGPVRQQGDGKRRRPATHIIWHRALLIDRLQQPEHHHQQSDDPGQGNQAAACVVACRPQHQRHRRGHRHQHGQYDEMVAHCCGPSSS